MPASRRRPPRSATKLPAIADDSGLCVAALKGEPGIYSARWAGPAKDFARAMQDVEDAVGASGSDDRRAWFVSALCIAWPDGHVEEFEGAGRRHARLAPARHGRLRLRSRIPARGHTRTFGEMTADEKHGLPPRGLGLSHRARAFVMLARPA